ncbi:hypothetical protein [Lentibacillus cibarius]|uniref:Uncharacterized protein n=1 Tax=Lentibacillus cibarius TaxID=2583219 RepID=A0A5S3QIS4_9BACI|nr:hypothetical protein [Lentibacillus cibarius]TMN21830.1 hypothetical protein FFL34_06670 [Lentibacillus cibarius]
MSTPAELMPIYDDRVNEILRSLSDGIPREDLAVKYKHRDYRSLDMYMRRKNFTWDKEEQNYKPIHTKIGQKKAMDENMHSGKVAKVIESFKEGVDPKTVAQNNGFKDHKRLAEYMTNKGYEWSGKEENYVRKVGILKDDKSNDDVKEKGSQKHQKTVKKDDELQYLVKTLYEKLNMEDNPIVDKMPRYLISGIRKNKTTPISHLLHELIENFGYEKNVPHREIIETALIDFFRNYGYKYEVEELFKNS